MLQMEPAKTPTWLKYGQINLGIGYAFETVVLNTGKIPSHLVAVWKISIIGVTGVKELEQPGGRKYMAFGAANHGSPN